MSIDITLPGPRVVGPGIAINLRSDFIGPLPQGSEWAIIVLTGPAQEIPYIEMRIPAVTTQTATYFLSDTSQSLTTTTTAQPAAQETIRLTTELRTPTGVIDSGTTTAPWDPTLGLGLQAALTGRASTGGFTAIDRENLRLAVDNTTTSIPAQIAGGLANAGMGKLFNTIPPGLLQRHGNSLHLTGNGSLSQGVEPFATYALGIEWIFDQPPGGFGFEAGNVVEYDRRMVQWMPVFTDRLGSHYWENLTDAHEAGQRLVWGTNVPVALNYWIAPGLGLTVTFLTLVLTP